MLIPVDPVWQVVARMYSDEVIRHMAGKKTSIKVGGGRSLGDVKPEERKNWMYYGFLAQLAFIRALFDCGADASKICQPMTVGRADSGWDVRYGNGNLRAPIWVGIKCVPPNRARFMHTVRHFERERKVCSWFVVGDIAHDEHDVILYGPISATKIEALPQSEEACGLAHTCPVNVLPKLAPQFLREIVRG